jgi:hypothetical protein
MSYREGESGFETMSAKIPAEEVVRQIIDFYENEVLLSQSEVDLSAQIAKCIEEEKSSREGAEMLQLIDKFEEELGNLEANDGDQYTKQVEKARAVLSQCRDEYKEYTEMM